MAVKIRLTRLGKKKKPFYRVVAVDSRVARDGRYLENLGYFDPAKDDTKPVLQDERVAHWLRVGAIPSETVKKLISSIGLIEKINAEKIEAKKSLVKDSSGGDEKKRKQRRKRYTTVAEMVKRKKAQKDAKEANEKKRIAALAKKKAAEATKAKESEASKTEASAEVKKDATPKAEDKS